MKITENKLLELIKWRNKYEINIQFWPSQISVYIAKDDVELTSFGGDFEFAISKSLEYIKRINKKGNWNCGKQY